MSLKTASCLTDVGRKAEVLAAIQDAQEMDGTLTETMSSEVSGLDLARSLNTLSIYLREVGRRQEALVVIHTFQRWLTKNPVSFSSVLEKTLIILSVWLREGRSAGCEPGSRRCTKHCRSQMRSTQASRSVSTTCLSA